MPLIVLEGPRRAGKFTFACDLMAEAMENPVVYKHNAFSTPKQMADDLNFVIEKNELIHIWDRSYLSEYVYYPHRPGSRGRNTLLCTPEDAELLYGRPIDSLGMRYVLTAPIDVLKSRSPDSSDIPVERELGAYGMLTANTNWKKLDISGMDLPARRSLAREVLKTVYANAANTQIPMLMLGAIGPPSSDGDPAE